MSRGVELFVIMDKGTIVGSCGLSAIFHLGPNEIDGVRVIGGEIGRIFRVVVGKQCRTCMVIYTMDNTSQNRLGFM